MHDYFIGFYGWGGGAGGNPHPPRSSMQNETLNIGEIKMNMNLFKKIKRKITLLRDLKHLFHIVMGFLLYSIYAIFSSWGGERLYKAGGKLYKAAQSDKDSLAKKIAINFFNSPLSIVVRDYYFLKTNADRQRLSTGVIQEYSDESLLGYGDIDYDKGGETLDQQQRGLMLPLLEESLTEKQGKMEKVIEIGCGNGDVLAYLAKRFPDFFFTGVDFFVSNARAKHGKIDNLTFVKGYALELLESEQLKGDILFASSTFCNFTPKELAKYLNLIKKKGITEIILSDPVWHGYVQENNSTVISKHIERSVWYHNYCGYLRSSGYKISDFSFFHYKHPKSVRPDIFVSLIRASDPNTTLPDRVVNLSYEKKG